MKSGRPVGNVEQIKQLLQGASIQDLHIIKPIVDTRVDELSKGVTRGLYLQGT